MNAKNQLFLRIARPYVRRRLRRNFFDVQVSGLERLDHMLRRGPLVLACNHVAWWDPLILMHLDAVLGSDGYCLMDQKSLAQLPFFRWVGALPIDRTSPRSAYEDLASAARILRDPGQILAIFPQGGQRPAHLPLVLKPGVEALARKTQAPVVACALRYDYGQSPRPIVHLSIGEALTYDNGRQGKQQFLKVLGENMTKELSKIDEQLLKKCGEFRSLLHKADLDSSRERIPIAAGALRALARSHGHD
jgi:1-acyl-sn-glycerol-3-phosphate acyltransferase